MSEQPQQRLAEALHKHKIGCQWRPEDHRIEPTGWVDDADHEAAARDIIAALVQEQTLEQPHD